MKLNPLSPKWQHSDAEVRLRSVSTGKLKVEVIEQLATYDESSEVRVAATNYLENPELLLQLSICPDPSVAKAARVRWVNVASKDLKHLEAVTAELPPEMLKSLVENAELLEFKLAAAALIEGPEEVEALLSTPNHTQVHQLLVQKIEDPEQLQRIQAVFTDKDKNVLHIVKSKLQIIKDQEAAAAALQAETNKLLDQLTALTQAEYSKEFARRLEVVETAWQKLVSENSVAPDAIAEAEKALIGCKSRITAAAKLKEEQDARVEALLSECQIVQRIAETSPEHISSLNDLHKRLEVVSREWPADYRSDELEAKLKPLRAFLTVQEKWINLLANQNKTSNKALLEKLQQLSWPEGFSAPATLAAKLAELEATIAEQTRLEAEKQKQQAEAQAQLDKLAAEIEAGRIKAANKLVAALNKISSTLNQDQSNQLKAHAKQLQDLKDWQGYATNPKREALCEQMEQLGNDPGIPVVEKAKAIKDLQQQWKSLGPSDSRQAQRLWSKFKKAGDKAYAPCAEYFAEQHAVREKNLEQREKICASLEQLEVEQDWENVDWKSIGDILSKARTEWHQYADVPNAKRNKIQHRFDKCTKQIQQRLNGEQARNLALKKEIVAEVTSLLSEDLPIRTIVDKTKALQQKWKSVGVTDRRQDQKLWKEFRRECDKVFEKRDEKVTEQKKQLDEIGNQARALCDEFASRLDSEAAITSAEINTFRKAFRAFPLDKQHSRIKQESESLLKKASKILDSQIAANKQQMLQEFQRQCELYDQHAAGELTDEALEAALVSDIVLDKTFTKRLEQKRANKGMSSAETAENILIRLEILAGIESPPESQAARMAYQVERLNKELSKGEKETRTHQQQVDDLMLDWFSLPGKDEAHKQRYQRVATKLGVV